MSRATEGCAHSACTLDVIGVPAISHAFSCVAFIPLKSFRNNAILSLYFFGGVIMKNHVWQDGRLLQTNKKWSHLKNSQRSWIQELTQEEHAAYVEKYGRLPMKKRKDEIVDCVYPRVNERGIWIPYREFHAHVYVMIDRLNHKSPLFIPSQKKPAAEKPKTPKANYEDFPAEAQEKIKCTLQKSIEYYIRQVHRIPPNKIRDSAIKQALRAFNTKQWKEYGMLMQSSDTLQATYHTLRENLFTAFRQQREIPKAITKQERSHLAESSVVLETRRLILRKMTGRDYRDIREMLSDPDVMEAWERTFTTKKEVMAWIVRQLQRYDKDMVGYFAAVDKQSGQIIGQIGLVWNDIQGKRCLEVGYILKKT